MESRVLEIHPENNAAGEGGKYVNTQSAVITTTTATRYIIITLYIYRLMLLMWRLYILLRRRAPEGVGEARGVLGDYTDNSGAFVCVCGVFLRPITTRRGRTDI